MSYIERQAAIDAVRQVVIKGYDTDYGVIDSDVIYEVLEDTPAADVVPVVHGEWIDAVIKHDSGEMPIIVCDKCSTFYPLQFGASHNFCPQCGAKMDGGKS